MFEDIAQIRPSDFQSITRRLRDAFEQMTLIGQIPLTTDDYLRLKTSLRAFLEKTPKRLELLDDFLVLVMMVFTARFTEFNEGFWPTFYHAIGLPKTPLSYKICCNIYKKATASLDSLYLPSGGYSYVTPILYHAVLPQPCVIDMARFLWRLQRSPGWETVIEMSVESLEETLPQSVDNLAKPLKRFIQDKFSRQIAARFVRDICETAQMCQIGDFQSDEITRLLKEHPAQQEVWETLQSGAISDKQIKTISIQNSAPRWGWNTETRRIFLVFPKQKLKGDFPPVAFRSGTKRYPVKARKEAQLWCLDTLIIPDLLLKVTESSAIEIQLFDSTDQVIHTWNVPSPFGPVNFFRPLGGGKLNSFESSGTPLFAGNYLVLFQEGLSLEDEEGPVIPHMRVYPPMGWAGFTAGWVDVNPPIRVSQNNDEVLNFKPAWEKRKRISLQGGSLLVEASNVLGVDVFVGNPPEVAIWLGQLSDAQGLQVFIRSSWESGQTTVQTLSRLIEQGNTTWNEPKQELVIHASGLFSGHTWGRFRVRFSHGFLSAGYEPLEFVVVPYLRLESAADRFAPSFPPSCRIHCQDATTIESPEATVIEIQPGCIELSWAITTSDWLMTVNFSKFSLPLRWMPLVLRSALVPSGAVETKWTVEPPQVKSSDLTFNQELRIQGFPGEPYQFHLNQHTWRPGSFDEFGQLSLKLAEFCDVVRGINATELSISLTVNTEHQDYCLQLLTVTKPSLVQVDGIEPNNQSIEIEIRNDASSSVLTQLELTARNLVTQTLHGYQPDVGNIARLNARYGVREVCESISQELFTRSDLGMEAKRTTFEHLFAGGVNFATLSMEALDWSGAEEKESLPQVQLWDIWLPLGAFWEVGKELSQSLWRQKIGTTKLWLCPKMEVTFSDSTNRINTTVKEYNPDSGEGLGDCTSRFRVTSSVFWISHFGDPSVEVWFEFGAGNQKRYAWICACGQILSNKDEPHSHSRRSSSSCRLITRESPVNMYLTRKNIKSIDWNSLVDLSLYQTFIRAMVGKDTPRVRLIAERKKSTFKYPVFHKRFCHAALAELLENALSDSPPGQALSELTDTSQRQFLGDAVKILVSQPPDVSVQAIQCIDDLFLKYILDNIPLSWIGITFWRVAMLNRYSAHHPDRIDEILSSAGLNPLTLTKLTWLAKLGGAQFFDFALCLADVVCQWSE